MEALKGPYGEATATDVGDVAFVASFPGGFVMHTLETARLAALNFQCMGRICVYRIEVVEVFDYIPPPIPLKAST